MPRDSPSGIPFNKFFSICGNYDSVIYGQALTEDYAVKIARDWNVPASGSGHVTRFEVKQTFIDQYQVQQAGGREHLEYWIPAEDLDAFNEAIVGVIHIVHSFP
jgi:hypothetical protein